MLIPLDLDRFCGVAQLKGMVKNMNRLLNILNYAYKHCEYYSSIFPTDPTIDINKIPLLTKDILQNRLNALISDEYKNSHIKFLKPVRTSGSTGKITKLFWNYDDYNASNLSIWRLRYKWHKILPTSKQVVFNSIIYNGSRIAFPPEIEYYQNNLVIGFSKFKLDDENIKKYLNEMEMFEPEWMLVQTSVLLRIAEYLKKYNTTLPKTIRYIELNGEMTTESTRKYFNEIFKVPMSNMYGAMEVNSIAYECPYGTMHVLEDNVFVETNDNNDAIVTSLHNKAVPIIRYVLGDRVILSDNFSCKCGCLGKTISVFQGRNTDLVKAPSGKYFSPYIFLYCIEKSNLVLNDAIIQYKIVQRDNYNIDFIIVIKDKFLSWEKAIVEQLNCNIQEVLKSEKINYHFKVAKEILDFNDSKFKMFESHI